MIKVEGHSNLYRDENTGAIVNCDTAGYDQYISTITQKDLRKKELDEMKKDIEEIKNLLKDFLSK